MLTRSPSAKPELDKVFRVHKDDVAAILDSAIAVVEAVGGRVELVVRAQRLQDEAPAGRSTGSRSLTVIIALPVAVGKVRESRGPFGSTKPSLRRIRSLKFSKPGHNTRNAVANRVVVSLESGPVDWPVVAQNSPRQPGDDRRPPTGDSARRGQRRHGCRARRRPCPPQTGTAAQFPADRLRCVPSSAESALQPRSRRASGSASSRPARSGRSRALLLRQLAVSEIAATRLPPSPNQTLISLRGQCFDRL